VSIVLGDGKTEGGCELPAAESVAQVFQSVAPGAFIAVVENGEGPGIQAQVALAFLFGQSRAVEQAEREEQAGNRSRSAASQDKASIDSFGDCLS